ncbi:MAG TPA: hydantoinase B/oxoprolinase family protein, partial [Alphaproteobacteria bacterium]|nr:hydantoinase B/oxoprolinase family protein [Alphaproteobacteria bacterium]
PVTYEVIRHNLWNINEEHGATIQRISGSPVAMFALDLNPSILTEDAEFVYFGPYMQYMSGVTDTQVKWILEYRSDNPGIRAGDMFLANDPWVGAAHQMDVMLICPVFHDGELFCWITNCLHQYDIGGITPGSFCPSAESAFDEGILIPPVKIVENDVVRRDIEALYLRSSRKPEMVALDFRAQLAGNMTAKARIEQLITRYGAKTVKSVMKKVIDNSEAAFLAKLKKLPDGVWRDRTYIEACRPGDRRTHRVQIALTKKGDKLIFDNEGTAPQDGAMNATYSGWRGSVMVAINELLSWDQYFAVGGALRHIEFDPVPGTLNCADFPASVSTAPTQSMEISLYPAYNIISKMLYSDEELRQDIMGIGGTSQWPTTIFRGIDQWGERYGYLLIDPIGGSIGAFAQGDGINTGGQARTPIGQLPNVEHNEQLFPLLFLYRKELPDSGGAGKFRGGLSAESCFIPHNTDHIIQDTLSSGNAIPTSTGMMGGYPSTTNAYTFIRESDILERMAASRLIEDTSEVSGKPVLLQLRQENFVQNAADVYAVRWSGGGGFGDPLLRDPERIAHDLEHLNITPAAAREIFGAVLDADEQVDAAATIENRAQIRAARLKRLGNGHTPREIHSGEVALQAGDNLAAYGA